MGLDDAGSGVYNCFQNIPKKMHKKRHLDHKKTCETRFFYVKYAFMEEKITRTHNENLKIAIASIIDFAIQNLILPEAYQNDFATFLTERAKKFGHSTVYVSGMVKMGDAKKFVIATSPKKIHMLFKQFKESDFFSDSKKSHRLVRSADFKAEPLMSQEEFDCKVDRAFAGIHPGGLTKSTMDGDLRSNGQRLRDIMIEQDKEEGAIGVGRRYEPDHLPSIDL